MSSCFGCGHDDIYGNRQERRERHTNEWICPHCRNRVLRLPDVRPKPRDLLDWLPLAKIGGAVLVLVSAILAIGAHW